MVPERLRPEIEELTCAFPGLQVLSAADGGFDLLIPSYPLPTRWTPESAKILVTAPLLYPDQQPDNFWCQPGLLTASGSRPNNCMGQVVKQGVLWDQYSWHWGSTPWHRDQHNMVTFARSIRLFFDRQP